MTTPWGEEVLASPATPWPEYPRPQLVREDWLNLNGIWDLAVVAGSDSAPTEYGETIRVPFPVESSLSGVGRRLGVVDRLWYRRRFRVPAGWSGRRVLLHFGAVDWETAVFVDGEAAGAHQGGYDAFAFDITPFLQGGGDHELVVRVRDPTEGDQPRGKQSDRPEGIFYHPSSGIWQTVWLEPVPERRVQDVLVTPDLAAGALQVRVLANDLRDDARVEIQALLDGQPAGAASGAPGATVTVPLQPAEAWSPENPVLYDLSIRLLDGTALQDRVRSYAGLREIRLGLNERGHRVLFLNGRPLFQIGVLDQGYWPDGLYTAPSDAALRHDLELARRLGFNLVRKHVKIEPQRWYYWADRMGVLVWQDMPSGNNTTEEGRARFEVGLQRMLGQLGNHPCIVMWVLFNEGWGQFDTVRLVRWLKAADPGRLIDNASGWTDRRVGEVVDLHSYPDPQAPAPQPARASVLGEFGGVGLVVEGHAWSDRTWSYRGVTGAAG
ncbi:MAG: glycoside hydrolase family 2 protein, partial [Anaerolineae bacterium]